MQAQPWLPPCAPGALTPWVAGRAARYATPGGFREAALAAGVRGEALRCGETTLRARLHMYAPGQPMARELAKNPTVLMVNDTLFAHGGVLPHHGAPWAAAAPAPGGVQCPPTAPPDLLEQHVGRAAWAQCARSVAAPTRPHRSSGLRSEESADLVFLGCP